MKNYKNFRTTKIAFASVLFLAFIIRIIQLFCIFDFETGFFTNHSNPLVIIFYILTVIGSIGLIVTEFAGKECFTRFSSNENSTTKVVTNKLTGIAQIILAALIIFNSKSGISAILEAKNKYGSFSFSLISEELGGKVFLLVPIFGILSAITLILHSVFSLTAKHFEDKIQVVTLFPVFWAILNVIQTFTVTASYIKQSELFVEIFAYTFAMIAFLGYGRAICDVGISESGKFFIPASYSTAIFSLMAFTYGIFSGEIKDNLIFAGLFVFFIALVYNFKTTENKVPKKN